MRTVRVRSGQDIWIGRQGENGARAVVFDLTEWEAEYGEGVAVGAAKRAHDYYAYPVALNSADGAATSLSSTTASTTLPPR